MSWHIRPRQRWRAVLSAFLLLIGLALAPVAVLAGWSSGLASDTDRFVTTLAPLGRNPDVRAHLSEQVVSAVDSSVDIDGYTERAFDALAVGRTPGQVSALRVLQGNAADGLRALVSRTTDRFLTSEEFPGLWDQLVRSGHQQVTGLLAGRQDQMLTAQGSSIVLNVGPLLARVRQQLEQSGFPLTRLIPTGARFVAVANVSSIDKIRDYYRLLLLAGWLLPTLSLLALVGAVVAARRRSTAVTVAGGGLLVGMFVLSVFLPYGRRALTAELNVPDAVVRAATTAITAPLDPLISGLAVLGGLFCAAGFVSLGRGAIAGAAGRAVGHEHDQ